MLNRCSSFFFGVSFGSGNWSSSAQRRLLLLRVFAGAGVESSRIESCDTDFQDVVVAELEDPVDKPGTTIGTEFSVLRCIFLPFSNKMWFLTTGPHIGTSRDLRRFF